MTTSGSGRRNLSIAYGFFVLVTVLLVVMLFTEGVGPGGENLVYLLLSGGFVVAGLGAVIAAWMTEPPRWVRVMRWVGLVIGLGLWAASPFAALGHGAGWTSPIGSTGRVLTVWVLAVVVWGAAAVAIIGGIIMLRKR